MARGRRLKSYLDYENALGDGIEWAMAKVISHGLELRTLNPVETVR